MQHPESPELSEETIDFHAEDVDFPLTNMPTVEKWIKDCIVKEGGQLNFINYIFCSDKYLHQINVEYLQHDTYTDIITFPYREDIIESDLFISTERVRENASQFKVSFAEELHRVMIHGVLHLLGFGDKTPEEKQLMREKENEYLVQIFPKLS